VDEIGLAQRELFRRWPSGASVVVAEADGVVVVDVAEGALGPWPHSWKPYDCAAS